MKSIIKSELSTEKALPNNNNSLYKDIILLLIFAMI